MLELPTQSGRALLATSTASRWYWGHYITKAFTGLPLCATATYPQVFAALGAAVEKK
jgi:hypothetical protein